MSLSEYSCKICSSEVKDPDPAVLCDLCEKWIHTDCASIEKTQYEKLKESCLPWYCPIASWNFPSLQSEIFKYFSMILIITII